MKPRALAPHELGPWEALTPSGVGKLIRGATFPWWIAGGWAVDLFLGRVTRAHADVEIAVLRADVARLRRWLPNWELWVAPGAGAGLVEWIDGEPFAPSHHELWCRDDPRGPWRLEVLLEEADGVEWTYRRDPRVRMPLASVGVHRDGLPLIRPEIALLYKSKGARERDSADFIQVLPALDANARRWLANALRAAGTGNEWLARLE